jgi:hypothetical protein
LPFELKRQTRLTGLCLEKKVLVIECPLSPHYHVHHPRRVTSWIAASCCWTSSPIDADADANADATAFAAAA